MDKDLFGDTSRPATSKTLQPTGLIIWVLNYEYYGKLAKTPDCDLLMAALRRDHIILDLLLSVKIVIF